MTDRSVWKFAAVLLALLLCACSAERQDEAPAARLKGTLVYYAIPG